MYNGSDRLLMERGDLFGVDTRNDNNNNMYNRNTQELTFMDDQNIGEITGEIFNTSEIDQGMPLRSNKLDNKSKISDNPHTDFELYNQRSSLNISYHDPIINNSGTDNKYADIGLANKLMNQNVLPENKLSKVINVFSWNFNNVFKKNIGNKNMLTSPYSILMNMIILYKGSKNLTEDNLKTFFNLPHKEEAIQSLFSVNSKLGEIQSSKGTNIILFPNNLMLNRTFFNYISNMAIIENVDMKNAFVNQSINKYIEGKSGGFLKDFFKANIIQQTTNVVSISSLIFYSKWKYAFDKVEYGQFNGLTDRPEQMMFLYNRELLYYENNNTFVCELDYFNNGNTDLAFGIISSKVRGVDTYIDEPTFDNYINNLKKTSINLLCLPKFRQENKYKLEKLFGSTGLQELFINTNLSDIVTNNNPQHVTDIVHHSMIFIDEKGVDNSKSNVVSNVNVVINSPFTYYIRYKPLNCVIFVGKYT